MAKPGGKGRPAKPRPTPQARAPQELVWKKQLAQVRDFAQRKLKGRRREIVEKVGSPNAEKREEGVRALAELPESSLKKKLLTMALKDPVEAVQKAAWDVAGKMVKE